MLRRTGFFTIAFAALAGPACGGKQITSDESIPPARYTLVSLNGQAPPIFIEFNPTGSHTVEVTGATFTIISAGRFTNSSTYRQTDIGIVTTFGQDCTGTFTQNQQSLVFQEVTSSSNAVCGRLYTGVWDGANRLTVDFDPTTLSIYEK